MNGVSSMLSENTEDMFYRLCLGQFLKANDITVSRLVKEVEGQIPRSTVYYMARHSQRTISVTYLVALADALTRILNRTVEVEELILLPPDSVLAI